MTHEPGEVTRLLVGLRAGNREAEGRLVEVVYGELHRMARRYMTAGAPGPHPSGHGTGQRGVHASGRSARQGLAEPRAFFRGRRSSDAPRPASITPAPTNP